MENYEELKTPSVLKMRLGAFAGDLNRADKFFPREAGQRVDLRGDEGQHQRGHRVRVPQPHRQRHAELLLQNFRGKYQK